MQERVFGGCRLTRSIADLVIDAGFTITELDTFYQPGAPGSGGALDLGAATPASTG